MGHRTLGCGGVAPMTLSEETLEELAEIRDDLEVAASTDTPSGKRAQALLDELDASEVST